MSAVEDRLRELANGEIAKYTGECLPTFFRWENLCALGCKPEKIFREMFEDDPTFVTTIAAFAKRASSRKNSNINLEVTGAFKARSNLCDRVPESWPAHPVLAKFLSVRPELRHKLELQKTKTFKDQLQLLEECEGWELILANDKVNKSVVDGLQSVMQLHYFGISMAEV